eukprot:Nk52_evm27s1485 gene=Nk52_evmTU27s1485
MSSYKSDEEIQQERLLVVRNGSDSDSSMRGDYDYIEREEYNKENILPMVQVTVPDSLGKQKKSAGQRYHHLDGLRGVACLIVVIYHWDSLFRQRLTDNGPFKEWGYWNPFYALIGGAFCVDIFFVLSGFVLAAPIFADYHSTTMMKTEEEAASKLIKRFTRMGLARVFRLGIPVMVATVFACAQHQLSLTAMDPGNLSEHMEGRLVGESNAKTDHISEYSIVFFYKLWAHSATVVDHPCGIPRSFLVIAITLMMCVIRRRRALVYAGIFYMLSWDYFYYTPFVAGIVLAQLNQRGVVKTSTWSGVLSHQRKRFSLLNVMNLLACVFVYVAFHQADQYQKWFLTNESYSNFFNAIGLPLDVERVQIYSKQLIAFTTVALVHVCPPLTSLFSTSPIIFLGNISFSVYLLHNVLIFSIGKPLVGYFYMYSGLSIASSSIICLPIYLACTIALSWPFTTYIEAKSPRWANRIAFSFM